MSSPSRCCHSVSEALVRTVQGQMAKCLLFGLRNLPRFYSHFPESFSCHLHPPPQKTQPQELGTLVLPSHTTFSRTPAQSEEEGQTDTSFSLVLLPDCILAPDKGSSVWAPPLDSELMTSAAQRTVRCEGHSPETRFLSRPSPQGAVSLHCYGPFGRVQVTGPH